MLSRVADSLYWMSRYLERAEHTARLVDVNLSLALENTAGAGPSRRWRRLVAGLRTFVPEEVGDDPRDVVNYLTFDRKNTSSVVSCVAGARENARQVREQISSEMWEQVNRLYLTLKTARLDSVWSSQPHAFFRAVKEGTHLFSGTTDATMTHSQGWDFIQVGACLERAINTANQLDVYFTEFVPEGSGNELQTADEYLEWVGLLRTCSGFEAYCKVYRANLNRENIAAFLLLGAQFPRSVRFAVGRMHHDLQGIAAATESPRRSAELLRVSGRLASSLAYASIEEILEGDLSEFLRGVQAQCFQIHDLIHGAYVAYPVEASFA